MRITCPGCGESFEADAGSADARSGEVQCPRCGETARAEALSPTQPLPPPGTASLPPGQGSVPAGAAPKNGTSLFPDSPRYERLGELGRGGMGVVYKAHDSKLNRVVALKVLIAGEGASDEEVRRFFQEATSAARLRHPNIIPIHELDVKQGRHYFTMDFVEGGPLSKLIAERALTPRRAVEILCDVAKAVHHAHEQGIIHRDLKPSNIIITPDGRPMVMDFGLAKQVESDKKLTRSGVAMGTPDYMAPEQARGRSKETDARTDVWALGAVLYEMVTGLPPFVGATSFEIVHKVVYDDPIPPRSFNRSCPRDVETICLKCLEKDPRRRYQAADELAKDCRRFLDGEAIAARPASLIYRARKRLARHKAVAAVTAIAALALLALAAWSYVRIVHERDAARLERDRAIEAETKEAEQRVLAQQRQQQAEKAKEDAHAAAEREAAERKKAEQELYFSLIANAVSCWERSEIARMARILEQCPASLRNWEWGRLHRLLHVEIASIKGRGGGWFAAYSPDGSLIAHDWEDGAVRVCDARTLKEIWSVRFPNPLDVHVIKFAPSGKHLAVAYGKNIHLYGTDTGQAEGEFLCESGEVKDFSFSSDEALLATVAVGGTLQVWDLKEGHAIHALRCGREAPCVLFDPSGAYLLAGCDQGRFQVWRADFSGQPKVLDSGFSWVNCATAARAPPYVAVGGKGGFAVWDSRDWQILHRESGYPYETTHLAFSPSGGMLAAANTGRTITVWDTSTWKRATELRGHTAYVWSVAFHPLGRRLVSGSSDHTVRIWDLNACDGMKIVTPGGGAVWAAGFSGDGKRIVSQHEDGTVRVTQVDGVADSRVLCAGLGYVMSVGTRCTGVVVAGGGKKSVCRVIEVDTGKAKFSLPKDTVGGNCVAVHAACKLFATGTESGCVDVWSLETGEHKTRISTTFVCALAITPDGRNILTGGLDGIVRAWDTGTGQKNWEFTGHAADATAAFRPEQAKQVYAVAVSPDGRLAASGGMGNSTRLWDTSTRTEVAILSGHTENVRSIVFTPDGTRVFTASWDGTVRVWQTKTGREILCLREHPGPVRNVDLSPDGCSLASAGDDGTIIIYEADPWWEPGNPPERPEPVTITPRPAGEAAPAETEGNVSF